MRQRPIPCLLMRGGTSKAACFLADDLPQDPELRDKVLLSVMGSPDIRQIDGLGGADPLTSKVAIISRSQRADCDLDYLFAQVVVDQARVDYGQNCGNILAAVGPFAIERGLVTGGNPRSQLRIFMQNTQQLAVAEFATPDGIVDYDGDLRIDGVPGSAAAITLNFRDTAGSTCGALLPTGNARDQIDGVAVTCIDNGMPIVVLAAKQLGCSGYESREQLDADQQLKQRLESIRLQAGRLMQLGDVSQRTIPKLTLVAPAQQGGTLCSRTFIPHRCHASIGVLGAVSVATCCLVPGSVAAELAQVGSSKKGLLSIEHPQGEFSILPTFTEQGELIGCGLLRTTRLIFTGQVMIPDAVWPQD